ncbi:MAG: hypothetical protein K2O14_12870 [Oscillospiraceae bacterium]|nr:hypothetical protein [Oscillospiraceae bacterium]
MVLFAGFDGSDNPARAVVEAVSAPCRRIILPNDKEGSAELLQRASADLFGAVRKIFKIIWQDQHFARAAKGH